MGRWKWLQGLQSYIDLAATPLPLEKVTLVATGPLTNVALFCSLYPELILGIEEIVFMGGGVGLGNRSAVAEFNILCDPGETPSLTDCSRFAINLVCSRGGADRTERPHSEDYDSSKCHSPSVIDG